MGVCDPGDLELVGVVLDVTTHRISDQDIAMSYDTAQGSRACATVLEDGILVSVSAGPFDRGFPQSNLRLTVRDGARLYDLEVDAGPPGMGIAGDIQLSYAYELGPMTTSYDTINQAGTGTVDVLALPLDGGTSFEFAAQGEIAGSDGWVFDLSFAGVVGR
jgi:hypothetical protein